MSMRLPRHLGIEIAAVLTVWVAPYSASAEIKPTDFNGIWSGSSTDRNLPLDSLQPTKCKTRVKADLRGMNSTIVCDGQAALYKESDLSIMLDGGKAPYYDKWLKVRQLIRSGSLVPIVATVDLKLLSRSSCSMHVAYLGFTMIDVVLTRTARR